MSHQALVQLLTGNATDFDVFIGIIRDGSRNKPGLRNGPITYEEDQIKDKGSRLEH
jgi:hypothetical protein